VSDRGTVLVTGGSGRVGARLLEALGEGGWRRRCLVHRRPIAGADESVSGDLADLGALIRAADGAAAIVHLAAVTHSRSPARYDEVNTEGTRNLLTAASAATVPRFLHVSTRAISPQGGAYSVSKLRAEEAVRSSDLGWTIVRLPEVYGAGGDEGVDQVLRRVRAGRHVPIVGRGDDVLCPAHVDDVVHACAVALETPAALRRVYTLAGPCLTMRELVKLAGDVFATPARTVSVPVPGAAALAAISRVAPLPLYPDQLRRLRSVKPPASAEAAIDLEFRPRRLEEGLAEAASAR
jgi:nucleoside-diphosphate-sugar epimerase